MSCLIGNVGTYRQPVHTYVLIYAYIYVCMYICTFPHLYAYMLCLSAYQYKSQKVRANFQIKNEILPEDERGARHRLNIECIYFYTCMHIMSPSLSTRQSIPQEVQRDKFLLFEYYKNIKVSTNNCIQT